MKKAKSALQRARIAAGYSQERAAVLVGYSVSAVRSHESSGKRRTLTKRAALKYAALYKRDWRELYDQPLAEDIGDTPVIAQLRDTSVSDAPPITDEIQRQIGWFNKFLSERDYADAAKMCGELAVTLQRLQDQIDLERRKKPGGGAEQPHKNPEVG